MSKLWQIYQKYETVDDLTCGHALDPQEWVDCVDTDETREAIETASQETGIDYKLLRAYEKSPNYR